MAAHSGIDVVTFSAPRRVALEQLWSAAVAPIAAVVALEPAIAAEDLGALRKYTALAPLGPADRVVGGTKRTGLPLADLAAILAQDVECGSSGKGGYFVSGDLTPEIFADDCRFADPTNDVTSLSKYQTALGILFDPSKSNVELVTQPSVNVKDRTISATIRSSGELKLPWRPRITPYTSDIVWHIAENGLIDSQDTRWSISAAEALRQTFSPR